ncbi:FMN-binding protein [candidate division WOR-3 bacterium]|uniref:FMN-binding protein n=1 Tax=candidate division WOR-3 bacterium TaxID=2052148 RepID=A0A9D5K7R5_UNCW3|nr:FMN-binding protein [candidate division WOR-3 bacterium]MBD3363871.1 FMN-binding protein [candidate division WOR-3 bacterium]
MSIKEKAWYPVLFMFLASVFFVAILVVFGAFTQPRVEANAQIAFERAALEASPAELPEPMNPTRNHNMYTELVADSAEGTAGALRFIQDGKLVAYLLPIEGQGFWAPIKGVIGIAADKRMITGIAFYQQEETPGLGGEIVNKPFRSQFEGKLLSEEGIPIEIRSVSAELDENSVHAVTGATQTSTRLGRFMNDKLTEWQVRMGVR